jgi:hypothetical protein
MENTSEHSYIIKSYGKAELCALYGVSREVFSRWIKAIHDLLPHYVATSKVFTPAQVKVIFEEIGTPMELLENRKIIVKKR